MPAVMCIPWITRGTVSCRFVSHGFESVPPGPANIQQIESRDTGSMRL